MPTKINLILAGNQKQYQQWLRDNQLDSRDYIYGCSSRHLIGLNSENCNLILVGEHWLNGIIEDDNAYDMLSTKFPGWKEQVGKDK